MDIKDVMADPAASSSNFIIFGTEHGEDGASLFSVDFGDIFSRTCSDPYLAGKCRESVSY